MNADTMIRDSPILALALPVWNELALRSAWFELQVRLAAGVEHPAASVTKNVGGQDGLLSLLFASGRYEPAEQDLLQSCAVVRNKLLHCEPDALLLELRRLDPTFAPPRRVTQLDLGGAQSAADVVSAIETRKGAVDVQDTSSRDEGFYGWMMEAATTGIFAKAIEVLERGIAVLLARRT